MSNGKIAGIAIGTLVIGIAIGFFIPTDSEIEQSAPITMQTESIDYEEQNCLVYGKRLIPDL